MALNTFMCLLLLLLLLLPYQSHGSPLPHHTVGIHDWTKGRDRSINSIMGGANVEPYSWPFLAYVQWGSEHPNTCGGTILSRCIVLTAKHCQQEGNTSVTAGEHNARINEGFEQRVSVRQIIYHTKFDVAILLLDTPFRFSEKIKSANLNSDPTCPRAGEACRVRGWGYTSAGKGSLKNPKPLEAEMDVLPEANCNASRRRYGPDQLCLYRHGRAPCNHDSGGPLVCGCSGNDTVDGMVLYGSPCKKSMGPDYFARMSHVYEWITGIIEQSDPSSPDSC